MNGHRVNTTRHSISQGFYGVTNSIVWGSSQTAGPIGTTFGTRLRIRLGMDIGSGRGLVVRVLDSGL